MSPDNAKFHFVDTETTSAAPGATVCEVGWVTTDANFNILEQHESLIDPQQMIDPSASGIHGLTNKEVADSPTLAEFFSVADPSCYGRPLEGPSVVVGHRVSFDMRFLTPHIQDLRQEICTLRWARKLYPESTDHKLSTLIYALGLPLSAGAHRVMADVITAYHLARHICDRTGMNLAQLAEASAQPMEVAICPIGKHKGERFSNVPRGYLRWMQGNMTDLDPDIAYTIDLHLNKKNNNE